MRRRRLWAGLIVYAALVGVGTPGWAGEGRWYEDRMVSFSERLLDRASSAARTFGGFLGQLLDTFTFYDAAHIEPDG